VFVLEVTLVLKLIFQSFGFIYYPINIMIF
jgi:hypothetical protein